MNTLLSKVTDKILMSDSPWQFRLLFVMVLLFFVGGLALDFLASNVTPPGGVSAEQTQEIAKMKMEFTIEKHKSLSQSASLLYDFAKIALGALIASITQVLKVDLSGGKPGQGEGK